MQFDFFKNSESDATGKSNQEEKKEKKGIDLSGLAQLVTMGAGAPSLGEFTGMEDNKMMFELEGKPDQGHTLSFEMSAELTKAEINTLLADSKLDMFGIQMELKAPIIEKKVECCMQMHFDRKTIEGIMAKEDKPAYLIEMIVNEKSLDPE